MVFCICLCRHVLGQQKNGAGGGVHSQILRQFRKLLPLNVCLVPKQDWNAASHFDIENGEVRRKE